MFSREFKYYLTASEKLMVETYRKKIAMLDKQLESLKKDKYAYQKLWNDSPYLEGQIDQLSQSIHTIKCVDNSQMSRLLSNKISKSQKYNGSHCSIDKESQHIIFKIYSKSGETETQYELEKYFIKSTVPFSSTREKHYSGDVYIIKMPAKYFNYLIAWFSDKSSDYSVNSFSFNLIGKLATAIGFTEPETKKFICDHQAATPDFLALSDTEKHEIQRLEKERQLHSQEYETKIASVKPGWDKYAELDAQKEEYDKSQRELIYRKDSNLANELKKMFPEVEIEAIINRETKQIDICFHSYTDMQSIKKIFEPICKEDAYRKRDFMYVNADIYVTISPDQRPRVFERINYFLEKEAYAFQSSLMKKGY